MSITIFDRISITGCWNPTKQFSNTSAHPQNSETRLVSKMYIPNGKLDPCSRVSQVATSIKLKDMWCPGPTNASQMHWHPSLQVSTPELLVTLNVHSGWPDKVCYPRQKKTHFFKNYNFGKPPVAALVQEDRMPFGLMGPAQPIVQKILDNLLELRRTNRISRSPSHMRRNPPKKLVDIFMRVARSQMPQSSSIYYTLNK